jgi:hypothetical protein
MERWKKGLVLLIAVVIAGTAVVATQYAKVSVSYSFKVSTQFSSIQLMASDGAISGTGYVLQNVSDVYTINLGTWMKGMNKVFTSAFAVVNGETGTNLRITGVDLTGLASNAQVRIWLHENMSTPSDYAIPTSVTREVGASSNQKVCNGATDATLLYYDNTTATDFSATGWVLAKADQAGEPYPTATTMVYHNRAPGAGAVTTATSTWDGVNHVWPYNTLVTASGLQCGAYDFSGTKGFANHVWVEVVVDTTNVAVSYLSISGTLSIFVKSV